MYIQYIDIYIYIYVCNYMYMYIYIYIHMHISYINIHFSNTHIQHCTTLEQKRSACADWFLEKNVSSEVINDTDRPSGE